MMGEAGKGGAATRGEPRHFLLLCASATDGVLCRNFASTHIPRRRTGASLAARLDFPSASGLESGETYAGDTARKTSSANSSDCPSERSSGPSTETSSERSGHHPWKDLSLVATGKTPMSQKSIYAVSGPPSPLAHLERPWLSAPWCGLHSGELGGRMQSLVTLEISENGLAVVDFSVVSPASSPGTQEVRRSVLARVKPLELRQVVSARVRTANKPFDEHAFSCVSKNDDDSRLGPECRRRSPSLPGDAGKDRALLWPAVWTAPKGLSRANESHKQSAASAACGAQAAFSSLRSGSPPASPLSVESGTQRHNSTAFAVLSHPHPAASPHASPPALTACGRKPDKASEEQPREVCRGSEADPVHPVPPGVHPDVSGELRAGEILQKIRNHGDQNGACAPVRSRGGVAGSSTVSRERKQGEEETQTLCIPTENALSAPEARRLPDSSGEKESHSYVATEQPFLAGLRDRKACGGEPLITQTSELERPKRRQTAVSSDGRPPREREKDMLMAATQERLFAGSRHCESEDIAVVVLRLKAGVKLLGRRAAHEEKRRNAEGEARESSTPTEDQSASRETGDKTQTAPEAAASGQTSTGGKLQESFGDTRLVGSRVNRQTTEEARAVSVGGVEETRKAREETRKARDAEDESVLILVLGPRLQDLPMWVRRRSQETSDNEETGDAVGDQGPVSGVCFPPPGRASRFAEAALGEQVEDKEEEWRKNTAAENEENRRGTKERKREKMNRQRKEEENGSPVKGSPLQSSDRDTWALHGVEDRRETETRLSREQFDKSVCKAWNALWRILQDWVKEDKTVASIPPACVSPMRQTRKLNSEQERVVLFRSRSTDFQDSEGFSKASGGLALVQEHCFVQKVSPFFVGPGGPRRSHPEETGESCGVSEAWEVRDDGAAEALCMQTREKSVETVSGEPRRGNLFLATDREGWASKQVSGEIQKKAWTDDEDVFASYLLSLLRSAASVSKQLRFAQSLQGVVHLWRLQSLSDGDWGEATGATGDPTKGDSLCLETVAREGEGPVGDAACDLKEKGAGESLDDAKEEKRRRLQREGRMEAVGGEAGGCRDEEDVERIREAACLSNEIRATCGDTGFAAEFDGEETGGDAKDEERETNADSRKDAQTRRGPLTVGHREGEKGEGEEGEKKEGGEGKMERGEEKMEGGECGVEEVIEQKLELVSEAPKGDRPSAVCRCFSVRTEEQRSVGQKRQSCSPDLLSADAERRLKRNDDIDDSILDFFLRFITRHVMTAQQRSEFYIFNSFFLPSLSKFGSDYQGAHKHHTRWLKNEAVPLPLKRVVFMPVNHDNMHWSLGVILNPFSPIHPLTRKGGATPFLGKPLSPRPLSPRPLSPRPLSPRPLSPRPLSPFGSRETGRPGVGCGVKGPCVAGSFWGRSGGLTSVTEEDAESSGARTSVLCGILKRRLRGDDANNGFLETATVRRRPTGDAGAGETATILGSSGVRSLKKLRRTGAAGEGGNEVLGMTKETKGEQQATKRENEQHTKCKEEHQTNRETNDLACTLPLPDGAPKALLIHLDSLRVSRRARLFGRDQGEQVKNFLKNEFAAKCGFAVPRGASYCTGPCCWGLGVPQFKAIPQQENGFDCGLFVISFVLHLVLHPEAFEALLCRAESKHHFSPLPRGTRRSSVYAPGKAAPGACSGPVGSAAKGEAHADSREAQNESAGNAERKTIRVIPFASSSEDALPSTPWFSQRHVTFRRKQLLKMLAYMREHPHWEDSPGDIEHLRALLVAEPACKSELRAERSSFSHPSRRR
ncbi:Ulp1 protease family, C-terminal catalytic domain-containing protein [Toxoplasma gondii TgCatPRC2]|uniref:Ulp1 protease family, C-terminal catalytic domain-containing protein n=1 Tax=Toxoplasma gondii TgCatPRC2 TaxID=1130821 RepID=A0A151H0V9_TOXGO|nr:Ulp1 protease family, C-terminal catalytic domain-containing protein [Toxoplasma gondii TgCatPRC2]